MDVDTRLLRYFTAVADELNYTRAAERLYVSQPALSKQLARLERQLGVQLFERTSRRVVLTKAGETLLPLARRTVSDWQEALGVTRAAARAQRAVLTVGFIASAANEFTPAIVDQFARRRPGWRVELRQGEWADPTAGLRDGSSDAALIRVPIPDPNGLTMYTLLSEPRCVALPIGHPLTERNELSVTDLLEQPFVATRGPACWRDWWLAAECRGGHRPIVAIEVNSPDEWLAAITSGAGVSFAPQSATRFYSPPGVTYRSVTGIPPTQVAVAHREHSNHPVTDDFVQAALSVTRSERR
ncbi:LysR family transcriptional regulator [Mycolicibacterium sp. BiH015]|uniref:LysR family transcriptional regulator n=1 Tax=Mycolicibacterium sp. BiH015 TaxID=3018808 RepID=UPI0022E8A940|nr:LysR family transcriptional regulator [Mycolicibacterium sp. BiH015]MDA2893453.1 LysR family transcriptional regulator [Mycolicibacterium sp. BiH015]